MKKFILKSLAILTIVLGLNNAEAQTERKNVVSLSTFPIAMGQYTLGYERVFGGRFSASLKFGLRPEGSLPGYVPVSEDFKNVSFKGTSIIPEIRFYTNKEKGPLKSFYLSLYGKFQNYTVTTGLENNNDYNSIDANGDTTKYGYKSNFTGTGNLKMTTFGIQLGKQWLISDRFSIDFWWFGPQFSLVNLNLDLNQDNLTFNGSIPPGENGQPFDNELIYKQIADELNTSLEDVPLVKAKAESRKNGLNLDIKTGLPSIRFGLSLGWAF